MGSELNVRVTEQELEYRSKNYRDIRAIEQRQLTCCSCGNVLSQESGRIYSHPIFGILQCENCKNHFKTVTFSLEKDDSVRVCHICGRERKNTYGCKKQDCPYDYCKNCIKRTIPKSLVDAESGKWKCFACNTQPLWKLRGACAAVMSSLPKRTKTKKVKSRNRSSDSEDDTTDLRKVSYVKRNRLEESKKLQKRLRDVCDDESPAQADEPQLQVIRRQKQANLDLGSGEATKIDAKRARADHTSRLSRKLSSSSDDSDLEEIRISKPKTVVKSQSEQRFSKNDRTGSTHRKPRNHGTHARSVLIEITDSSSDDESELRETKDNRKPKLDVKNSLIKGKRTEKASTNDRRTSGETMPSTRKSRNAKKDGRKKVPSGNEVSDESGDSSSDDSDSRAIKDLMPSVFAKEKTREKKKSVAPRGRKDSSEEEMKSSRDKSKGGAKSSSSKSSNVTSKSNKISKLQGVEEEKKEEEEEDDNDDDDDDDDNGTRKKAKKPLVKSPGPKSFKNGTKPRREKLPAHEEDDSDDIAARRSARNKQKRKTGNADEREKSVGQQLLESRKQASDSSSGKEFKEKKMLRPTLVALQRIHDLEEDLTAATAELSESEASSTINKDQTFALKNTINNFYTELKVAATKLLNDAEKARKSYRARDTMRVDEANRMVLETKNVVKKFREIVDKSDTKVTDDYDKWCVKARVRNVLRRSTRNAEKPSTPRPASATVAAKTAEESGSESSTKSNASSESKPEAASTLANGEKNVVVSECDSEDIFSADESRRSINPSGCPDLEEPEKNEKDENTDASEAGKNERSSRDATADESKNVADSSDKEASDAEAKLASPTMSEFSGLSDNELITESVTKSRGVSALLASADEAEPMDTASDTRNKENSAGESEKEDEIRTVGEKSSGASSKIRKTQKIQRGVTALASDSESEGTKKSEHLDLPGEFTEDKETRVENSGSEECETRNEISSVEVTPDIPRGKKIQSNATIPDSDDETEGSNKAEGVDSASEPTEGGEPAVADSENEEGKVKSTRSSDATSKSRKTRRRRSEAVVPDTGNDSEGSKKVRDVDLSSEPTGDKEIPAVDSETEELKTKSETSNGSSAKTRKTRKIPSVAATNGSDSESEGSKKTEVTSPTDAEAPEDEQPTAADDGEMSSEETSISAKKADSKLRKKAAGGKSDLANDEKKGESLEEKEPIEVESCDIASASTEVLSPQKCPDEKDDSGDNSGESDTEKKAENAKESSSPKPAKKIDGTRRSDSARRSSSDTMMLENSSGIEASPQSELDSSETTEIVTESQNTNAKQALLASSNSDDSTSDEREYPARDSNDAPPTPPESDSKSETNLASNNLTTERENNEKTRKRRARLRLTENRYYMADPKLKRKCVIRVKRLKEKILSRYSRALRKSREYVESRNIKRLAALGTLDKDRNKASGDTTDDESKSSSKDLKRKKTKLKAKEKEKEETLLDHLNKVDNGEAVASGSESDAGSATASNKDKAEDNGEDRLLAEANRMAKKRLLESSDSNAEEEEQSLSDAKDETKDETKNENKKVKQAAKKEKLEKSSDNEEKKEEESEKNRWRKNKILTSKISDSDSEEEMKKFNTSQEKIKEKNKKGSQSDSDEEATAKKTKKKRVRRRVLHSDSDVVISSEKGDSDSDSSVQSIKKKKKKKKGESSEDDKDKKKTRKRTRKGRRSSDSSGSDERPKVTRRKRIKKVAGSDSDSDPDSQGSPGKAGRKNIRKVLRDKQVAEDTKQAAKEEEERLKRIAERQKLYNEMYEVRLAGEEKVDKLVLDFDEETKEPLVSVEEGLVKRLKPHQAQGIKFMWDACFESLERIRSTKGSGCILAHCMGLGKTFQVVTLAHTLLTHEETDIKTILVVCPLSTVLNWANEFKIWLADLEDGDDIEVYEMTKMKKNFERKFQLARWHETGGVMIIGYEMFRNLTQQSGKKVRKNIQETFLKCLVDPGPDLIVCDEGHLLKNEDTALSKAMRRVKTLRRVVLTGTPLQNNLIEYHCMVQFVKPNLLGTKKEFMNRFENPITNGQFDDSTEYDVKLMKKRAHILHKLLEGSVQRFDYSVLTPFLPPKQEYVIFVKLTKIQIDMYRHYLDNYARRHRGVGGSLFADFQALQRIWTHPMVMQMNAEKVERANEKKRLDASDTEGSLKDFIDDDSDTPCTSASSSDASDDDKGKKTTAKRSTRANPVVEEPAEDDASEAAEDTAANDESQWWTQYVKEEDYEDIRCSSKLLILFRIIKESEQIGDKLLVFSQSLYSLTLIEKFLQLIDEETQKDQELETLDGHSGSWSLGLDYFRLDGQTSADNRRRWCDIFNRPTNTRARLFLISTRAGGLGINLTAANRVVIFDASWNPSHDVQSIFRIYRFGQKKPCYVYRLLAAGTMEEKIYNRQVTKLSLSCRVVDEQQIERHYSNNALAELYQLELPSETEKTLNLPKDRLLAEIFSKYKSSVENYHEHDSLLENQAGEELDEEERQQAWVEYEEEKKGKRMMPPMAFNYQDPILMQQISMMNMGTQNALNNPAMVADYQNLQRLMEKDYPGIPEAQQKILASRAVFEMYNYVEKQAMASHGAVNMANLNMANLSNMNMGGLQGAYNNQIAQSVNPGQTYMDMLRMQQQQALAQQQNGQVKYASSQQQLRNDILRQQQQLYAQSHNQNKQPYAQKQSSHLQAQSTSTSMPITIDDDDIMEVIASTDQNLVPPAPAADANPKNKEE